MIANIAEAVFYILLSIFGFFVCFAVCLLFNPYADPAPARERKTHHEGDGPMVTARDTHLHFKHITHRHARGHILLEHLDLCVGSNRRQRASRRQTLPKKRNGEKEHKRRRNKKVFLRRDSNPSLSGTLREISLESRLS